MHLHTNEYQTFFSGIDFTETLLINFLTKWSQGNFHGMQVSVSLKLHHNHLDIVYLI